jgi:hypothetical protein
MFDMSFNRALTTFAIFVVIICAIRSVRRGDGARGSLVTD